MVIPSDQICMQKVDYHNEVKFHETVFMWSRLTQIDLIRSLLLAVLRYCYPTTLNLDKRIRWHYNADVWTSHMTRTQVILEPQIWWFNARIHKIIWFETRLWLDIDDTWLYLTLMMSKTLYPPTHTHTIPDCYKILHWCLFYCTLCYLFSYCKFICTSFEVISSE